MPELFTEVPRDDRGRVIGLWTRRAWITLFALIVLAALIGFIGQRSHTSSAASPAATLTLRAPQVVRGGVFFEARIDIRARQPIEHPRLVFDEGWLEGLQMNSIEPAAESESSRDGRLVLSYGSLEPGDLLRVYTQLEVNPTSNGVRPFHLELDDEARPLARLDRTIRVLP
jgi:hypothetical protein